MEAYETLEQKFGEFVNMGSGEMVACSSGTAALHLALEAMELPLGSRVIMSDYNMIACPRAATLAGLNPVFVDCNEELLMCPKATWKSTELNANGTFDISALLNTHIYGRHDQEWVNELGAACNVPVIEDMSEIHGVSPHNHSDAACWSFYKNKIISCQDGEGGIVWFQDPVRAKVARELRSLGFTEKHDYVHRPKGHNYRMSNCHAELILKSLSQFKENNEKRNQIEEWYDEYILKEWQMPLRDAVWVYDLRIPNLGYQRLDFIIKELNAKGITARHGFKPMTMQAEYLSDPPVINPNSEEAGKEVLYLPVYPSMTETEVRHNAEALQEAYQRAGE